jgi:hypothetical protein
MSQRNTQRPKVIVKAFYVYDNIHDWINEVSLGCGLADQLCHFDMSRYSNSRGMANPIKFVEYVNKYYKRRNLPTRTSLEEVRNLLQYHHPNYTSSKECEKKVFVRKAFPGEEQKEIMIDNPILRQIVELRNAYVSEFNYQLALEQGYLDQEISTEEINDLMETQGGLPLLTLEAALSSVIPQLAMLPGENGPFNVADVLDVDLMLADDDMQYTSSIVTSGLVTVIMVLMGHANKLFNSESRTMVKIELLGKYFGGTDLDYSPGQGTDFYLGGKLLEAKPRTAKSLTAFEQINVNTRPGREPDYSSRLGVKGFAASQLAHLYRIPDEKLDPEYQKLLDPLSETGRIIYDRLEVVRKYLSSLNDVQSAYERVTLPSRGPGAVPSRIVDLPARAVPSRMRINTVESEAKSSRIRRMLPKEDLEDMSVETTSPMRTPRQVVSPRRNVSPVRMQMGGSSSPVRTRFRSPERLSPEDEQDEFQPEDS